MKALGFKLVSESLLGTCGAVKTCLKADGGELLCLNRVDIGVDFSWKGAASLPARVPASPVAACTASSGRASDIVFILLIVSRKFNKPLGLVF